MLSYYEDSSAYLVGHHYKVKNPCQALKFVYFMPDRGLKMELMYL